ncbi:MAG TPA: heme exporter protein CcmB [Rhodospirillaceae bacterium]|nr:heme exporter protein CcmB [Rhodospirillaceae bacterium]MBB56515.1 heme exporter protein CcmB [Rhodospirillaceae bacterium]HAE01772.1 heme exporter protein CcmB [Rhodospirillaceae bacterium]HBM14056.1 heme exporter protein CcmB [Rhodospirillaceae bacterium]|tara:strand:+ start:32779 stop:33459 length:681 start_codon:yes stop_codon:yes gene_type:complete
MTEFLAGFSAVLIRDLRLALRQSADLALVLGFFTIAASLFPFGVGPAPETLARIAPGVIWVLALLSVMLSLDRLFEQDLADGSLEQMVLTPRPLVLTVLAKALAHWLTTGLPLIAITPVIGILLNFPTAGYSTLLIGLALGTPSLSLIGAVGAALTLGARRAGLLIALLVLPLYIPILIFGVTAVDSVLTGFEARAHFLYLAAILVAAIPLAPLAAAAAVRHGVEG